MFILQPDPSSEVVPAGSSVMFRCSATGFPIPSVTWFRDGRELSSYDNSSINIAALNSYTIDSNLSINFASLALAGRYWCLVRGSENNQPMNISSNSTQLEITCESFTLFMQLKIIMIYSLSPPAPPNLILGPDDHALFSSIDIVLSCSFRAIPAANITWTYIPFGNRSAQPTLLSPGGVNYNFTSVVNSKGGYAETTSNLTIISVSESDAGDYICTGNNGIANLIGAQSRGQSLLIVREGVWKELHII